MQNTEVIRGPLPNLPWYRRAGAWIGIGINPGSLTVGGGLASQLPLPALLLLIPVGALALTALAVTQGIVGRRRREALAERAASTFGSGLGAGLLNLLMALGMIGWGSFYVGLAGFSLASLLSLPLWVGALTIAGTSFILSELGLNRWNSLVWITTLSALGVAIVALIAVGARPTFEMTTKGLGLYELLWVTGSVLAYAILFALRCSDFTWDLNADSDVIKAGLSLLILLMISLSLGAILYQATGDWNLADILVQTHLAWLGQLFLLAAIASPSLSGLHSGALALGSITRLSKRQSSALICTVNFFLGATRFDYQLLPFLSMIGAILPPALVVMLATAVLRPKPSATAALAGWLVGAAVAIAFKAQGQLAHIVVGAAVSLIVLKVMMLLPSETRKTADSPAQPD
jgi:hypothetical protein